MSFASVVWKLQKKMGTGVSMSIYSMQLYILFFVLLMKLDVILNNHINLYGISHPDGQGYVMKYNH